jgi:hypothetical protein
MSGEKQVMLRESEYRKLMDSTKQVDALKQRERAMAVQVEKVQESIRNTQAESFRRQHALEQSISNLSDTLQTTTLEFNQRLREQQKTFDKNFDALDQRIDNQRAEYTRLIADQTQQFNRKFAQIEQKESNKKQYAEQWIADAQVLVEYIGKHLRHDKFAPGGFSKLNAQLAMAQGNIKREHYDAAIATSQALYIKALELQAEIEFQQAQWDIFYTEAQQDIRKLLVECEVQQSSQWVFDTEQGNEKLDAEIDYWGDGALSRFKQKLEEQLKSLDQEQQTLTLDQLRSIITASTNWQTELKHIVEQAKERLIASQLRVNLAEDLLEELAKSGWKIEDSAWEGSEQDQEQRGWKNSYHVKLKNLSDDEMVTIIMPEPTSHGQIENTLQFAYYPKNNNDARFAANQTKILQQMLNDSGLTSQPLSCVPGHEHTIRGDESRRDFEKVRQAAFLKNHIKSS